MEAPNCEYPGPMKGDASIRLRRCPRAWVCGRRFAEPKYLAMQALASTSTLSQISVRSTFRVAVGDDGLRAWYVNFGQLQAPSVYLS